MVVCPENVVDSFSSEQRGKRRCLLLTAVIREMDCSTASDVCSSRHRIWTLVFIPMWMGWPGLSFGAEDITWLSCIAGEASCIVETEYRLGVRNRMVTTYIGNRVSRNESGLDSTELRRSWEKSELWEITIRVPRRNGVL